MDSIVKGDPCQISNVKRDDPCQGFHGQRRTPDLTAGLSSANRGGGLTGYFNGGTAPWLDEQLGEAELELAGERAVSRHLSLAGADAAAAFSTAKCVWGPEAAGFYSKCCTGNTCFAGCKTFKTVEVAKAACEADTHCAAITAEKAGSWSLRTSPNLTKDPAGGKSSDPALSYSAVPFSLPFPGHAAALSYSAVPFSLPFPGHAAALCTAVPWYSAAFGTALSLAFRCLYHRLHRYLITNAKACGKISPPGPPPPGTCAPEMHL